MPWFLAYCLALAMTSPFQGRARIVAFAVVWTGMCLAIRRTTAGVQ